MSERLYHQYCPVARALEQLGGRWTLLIIRELESGPKRYSDLMSRLQGIGTNMLAARVKELEQAGIVERATLPPPAGSRVYVLTELGNQIRPVLRHLADFGGRFMDRRPTDLYRPSWLAQVLLVRLQPEQATGLDEDYEFRVADEVFHVHVEDGDASIALGPAFRPALVVITDRNGLDTLARGQVIDHGEWIGDDEAKRRFHRLFAIPDMSEAA